MPLIIPSGILSVRQRTVDRSRPTSYLDVNRLSVDVTRSMPPLPN